MTDTTPRVGAPLLAANQAQKSVTHNEALYQFDALLCPRFLDRDLTAPPSSPADGDTYLIKATATAAWTGQDGKIAYCADGNWRFYAPFAGLVAYVTDEAVLVAYNGTAWVNYSSLIATQNIPMLGVNTTADATSKLSVLSNAALFGAVGTGSGGSGDVRATFSKQASGNTASLLFQDDFSSCAEIGLTGDDNFHFKVSPDGSAWTDAMIVNRSTGAVGIGMAPSNVLDITQCVNAAAQVNLLNNNTGAAARMRLSLNNGAGSGDLFHFGASWTTSGINRQNGTLLAGNGAGGLTLASGASQPIYFAINNSEVARFGTDGSFVKGTATNGGWTGDASIAVQSAAAAHIFSVYASNASASAMIVRVDAASADLSHFYYAGSSVGSITTNGSVTAYNTSSGIEVKSDIVPMDPALAINVLKAYAPKSYNHKADNSPGHGFVVEHVGDNLKALGIDAQAMGLVRLKSELSPAMMDYAKATPFLTAAALDHEDRLAALEREMADLRGEAAKHGRS
jgi:hypothetical protein